MRNERGAGRKPVIHTDHIEEICNRISAGERVADIAAEYEISRQAVYKMLKNHRLKESSFLRIDYLVGDILCTRIEANFYERDVHVIHYAKAYWEAAFRGNSKVSWEELEELLETIYLRNIGVIKENNECGLLCRDIPDSSFSMNDLADSMKVSQGEIRLEFDKEVDLYKIPRFEFTRKDILYSRSDTDGYQLKALSKDRRLFVKAQLFLAGVPMNDWTVEILASNLCTQLGIPCVVQKECEFVYGTRSIKGVYSRNFELDGYSFLSFEGLLAKRGKSTSDEAFIRLNAMEKLKWCARELAEIGNIPYDRTLKYMIDLALIDCLVGNVDRHTKNFGLFYDNGSCRYEIPLIFDSGMGLFEHDDYRDHYESYHRAMNNVYIAPYGEDPFDMLKMLDKEFHLLQLYPELSSIRFELLPDNRFAKGYVDEVQGVLRELGN